MINSYLKTLFITLLITYTHCITYAQQDTIHIYFRLDNIELQTDAQRKLDQLIYDDRINPSQTLLIIGYADHLGSNAYNDTLSLQRAGTVKNYLQNMGIPEKQISMCIGRGEIPRDVELPEGYAADRRVDIAILKDARIKAPTTVKPKPAQQPPKYRDTLINPSATAIRFNSTTNIDVEELQVGQLLVLDKIFFHTGRHMVVKESIPELNKLYELLHDNPTLSINIEGHVCCVSSMADALDYDTAELALSVNRAKHIYNYLVKRGIDAQRLSYKGFGKTRPLSESEETQEEQDMNKRVEIRILEL